MRDTIEQLARTACNAVGVEFYELEIKPGRQGRTVSVFLTAPDGVTIDQCAQVSRLLGEELDRVDPFPGAYLLEVSSAGLERKLTRPEHWQGALGLLVKIGFQRDGKSAAVTGKLVSADSVNIVLNTGKAEETIPAQTVKKARTVFDPSVELKRR